MIQEATPRYRALGPAHLDRLPQLAALPDELRREMKVVASVLPFRVNEHVLERLIDWERVPQDPMFQLLFPQRGMLSEEHYARVAAAHEQGASREELAAAVDAVRAELNPHPAGQLELNVPVFEGEPMRGMQHKYRETVLFFPAQGQTCHAYCSFCFRWAPFVGDAELKMAGRDAERLHGYLAAHPDVSDLLLTGGDPMIMRTDVLRQYVEPLLRPELEHVTNLRIGTKALTFWPQRFVTDPDADDLLRLVERLVEAGKHVAVMAHLEHWRELDNEVAREAVRRLRDAGAVLRSQAPLLRHVNDDPAVWARAWREQVALGIVPYYMFCERDTGARRYFEVPLARCYEVYQQAVQRCSGLARTVRGPSMSCAPGKVEITGRARVAGEEVFVLRFLQGRDPDWVDRPFFARFDPRATWMNDLRPALGDEEFFFEARFRELQRGPRAAAGRRGGAARGVGAPTAPAR
jgi:KamA family protein